jgi:hypothetical protein
MVKLPQEGKGFRDKIGLGVCVLATLLAIVLHITCLTHAGALWRDEAGGVQLAASPALAVTCKPAREYFPILFFALVRCWYALGLGGTDFGLRFLGFLIGMTLLAAIWLNARLMGVRWPLISLALLAANITVVRWGDSLRAYGCGAIFCLLTLGLLWRLVRTPGVIPFVFASLAATLSVQTLYSNAFLVLGACLAASAICVGRRLWKAMALVMGAGVVAAASLLPYLPQMQASRDCVALHQMGFDPDFLSASLTLTLGSGRIWPVWVWLGFAPLVVAAVWEKVLAFRPPAPDASGDLAWFGIAALGGGVALFIVFLTISKLPAEPWYFLPLMVFACASLDAALLQWLRPFSFAPSFFAIAIVCAMFPTTFKLARYHQTNVDLIAAGLTRRAQPGDLVMVSPAYCGISFARYFKAPIDWITLPPIDDHSCHRLDLLRQNLCSKDLLATTLDRAEHTLKSGHTLWVVGSLSPPAPGEILPPDLPPPPGRGEPFGYNEGCACGYVWERQIAHLLDSRGLSVELIHFEPSTGVIPDEDLPVIRASGWREPVVADPPKL